VRYTRTKDNATVYAIALEEVAAFDGAPPGGGSGRHSAAPPPSVYYGARGIPMGLWCVWCPPTAATMGVWWQRGMTAGLSF
jgi:hypothetical protein